MYSVDIAMQVTGIELVSTHVQCRHSHAGNRLLYYYIHVHVDVLQCFANEPN